MNTLITYESRRGHTRRAAEAIAAAARGQGHDVVVKAVGQVQAADVQRADVLFVGTWVQGLIFWKVRPAGAERWIPALPPLTGKPVGVFCTYAFNPRCSVKQLGSMLKGRGADIKGERTFHRARPAEGADQFFRSTLQAAGVAVA